MIYNSVSVSAKGTAHLENNEIAVKKSSDFFCRPGVIYFIAAGLPPRAIKIGMSQKESLLERLRSIQSSNHEKIRLMGIIEYGPPLEASLKDAEIREQEICRQFHSLAFRKEDQAGHEWFRPESELISFVMDHGAPLSNDFPNRVEIEALFGLTQAEMWEQVLDAHFL